MFTIAGVQFTHILDFIIMMPLGPQFTRLFGISDAQFGLLVSAYTLSAGASGLLAATYVDRFDRRTLLLWLYALFGLATLACGLAPDYGFLMGARVAAGIFGGVLSALAQTIVADVVPFERRGRAMGIVMSAFSVATVAGVPLGLWLAGWLGWHAAFLAIAALCGLAWVGAALTLPPLREHLQAQPQSLLRGLEAVLAERNHWRAFAMSALMMFTGFTVIPFITIYVQANVGLVDSDIPLMYLVGGAVTLVTARWFGRMTDRRGKVPTFTRLAWLVSLPLMATTLMPPVPLWAVLIVSTSFFVIMSGRMIPGMAIITSAAEPRQRGAFMALNASVQSAAMGLASLVGGLIIARDAAGRVEHYWIAGLIGVVASIASAAMARRLRLHGSAGPDRAA